MVAVTEGVLAPGLPYWRMGSGPALVMTTALTPDHAPERGLMHRLAVRGTVPWAEHFTVYVVGRKPGLGAGSSMADIAGHYAQAIEVGIGAPVLLWGASTGGSVALQLAVDHPSLVSRLVLASAACRLSDRGRALMQGVARRVEQEGLSAGWAEMMSLMAPAAGRRAARAVGRVATRNLSRANPSDLLAVIAAEDEFDVERRLDQVSAPTLVIGGARDVFYSEDLFRRTAAGVVNGRAVVFRHKGHAAATGSARMRDLSIGFLLG